MRPLKLFYTTDIHGSETCFMKFLNSAKYYGADVLIMGGDVTGKMLVPIVDEGNGSFRLTFLGREQRTDTDGLPALEKQVRQTGYYPYRTSPDELETMHNSPDVVSEIFLRVMYEAFDRWLAIAEDRLRGTDVRVFITPGNDDEYSIDEAFADHPYVVNPEGSIVPLSDEYEMISTGYANLTPWDCPRDISEDALTARIEAMAKQVSRMETCIFNLHCPPFDSLLDLAPQLDENMRPVMGGAGGGAVMVPVGSTAVADAIRAYQPLLGLHGHIHESRGIYDLGKTKIVNPGSEYAEGYLRGALITLSKGRLKSCQLTAG